MAGIDFQTLEWSAAVLLMITTLLLVAAQDWRLILAALFIQYIGVFVLVAIHWPIMMAFSKLLAGWIATAVLAMAIGSGNQSTLEGDKSRILPSGIRRVIGDSLSVWVFKTIAALMIVLAVFTLAPAISEWIPGVQFVDVLGALILLGLGLLHLGLTALPFRVIPALLTVLSGFEIIYASVEVSALVAGLLAGVTLGLALTGAYLLVNTSEESGP